MSKIYAKFCIFHSGRNKKKITQKSFSQSLKILIRKNFLSTVIKEKKSLTTVAKEKTVMVTVIMETVAMEKVAMEMVQVYNGRTDAKVQKNYYFPLKLS